MHGVLFLSPQIPCLTGMVEEWYTERESMNLKRASNIVIVGVVLFTVATVITSLFFTTYGVDFNPYGFPFAFYYGANLFGPAEWKFGLLMTDLIIWVTASGIIIWLFSLRKSPSARSARSGPKGKGEV